MTQYKDKSVMQQALETAKVQAVKQYEAELARVEEQIKGIDFGKYRKPSKEKQ